MQHALQSAVTSQDFTTHTCRVRAEARVCDINDKALPVYVSSGTESQTSRLTPNYLPLTTFCLNTAAARLAAVTSSYKGVEARRRRFLPLPAIECTPRGGRLRADRPPPRDVGSASTGGAAAAAWRESMRRTKAGASGRA